MGYSIQIEEKEFRKALRRLLNLSDDRINEIVTSFDKNHKHMNAVNFIIMLNRFGIPKESIGNFLKMFGVDEVTLINLFDEVDNLKNAKIGGKVYEIELE